MNTDDAISISSNDSDGESYVDRRAILTPAIHSVVAALGGYEGSTYTLGDEAHGCLKDLKKFWRKDDTDDERTVARIFWETRVLPNDLVPILLETAGKGKVEDKCAIACADLVTSMTWPIDMAEELKELDDEFDKGTDYTQLLQSHLHYKAALLRPGVLQALVGVMLPCLTKDKKEQKERDAQVINVVLHLFRNLAFIKDQPPNMFASSDQVEFSSLQSKLIQRMSEAHVIDLLLTIASNAATDTLFNRWNTLVLETFYLLFRGVKPSTVCVSNQEQQAQGTLSRLLEAEARSTRNNARKASSRHSRFGTTISVKLKPGGTAGPAANTAQSDDVPAPSSVAGASAKSQTFVLHRQQALNKEAGSILDMTKRKVKKKGNKVDDLGRQDNLSTEALVILQNLARTFIESCFNPFLASLLKDIKSERPKITEKDNLRLLFVTKWFLEFFLAVNAQDKDKTKPSDASGTLKWDFGLVAEVTERGWIIWVLKRMREAVEEKPKLWTELQAGLECLTQLLCLIYSMSAAHIADPVLNEAAELLQQQLVYNGEVLDIAVEALRSYKEGVQSLTYLDASVHLAYALLRMLERWAKARGDGEMYVRKRAKPRRKASGVHDTEDVPDEDTEMQAEETERMIHETMFTFEAFEAKFAHEDITRTLMIYLARYEDFTSSEEMKRVVNLLHRQAVKAKAEGLFFKVSTLNLFKNILAQQRMLPRDQPYKDLVALINYILRKFFKAVNEEPLLIVEAFFPKNRGRWKQFSSWEPEKKSKRDVEDSSTPQEVRVKKGYSWSEQLGIVIACLVEAGQNELIDWVKEILILVIALRQRIVDETDGSSSQTNIDDMTDDDVREAAAKLRGPSNEALAKFEDYSIPYVNDERADAATKNPHLKLVFKLIKFAVLDDNADELEWYVPAAVVPSDLQSSLNVICQFLESPLDLGGKKAAQLLSKRRRRRTRRAPPSDEEGEADADADDDDEEPRQKRVKKKKEKEVYKSAQFIEDSDVEYGDDDAFWAKERALRERTALLAADDRPKTMRSTGTKKRRKKGGDAGRTGERKKRKGAKAKAATSDNGGSSGSESVKSATDVFDSPKQASSSSATTPPQESDTLSKAKARPRPRPRPRFMVARSPQAEPATSEARLDPDPDLGEKLPIGAQPEQVSAAHSVASDDDAEPDIHTIPKKGRKRIVISDDEE